MFGRKAARGQGGGGGERGEMGIGNHEAGAFNLAEQECFYSDRVDGGGGADWNFVGADYSGNERHVMRTRSAVHEPGFGECVQHRVEPRGEF